jgi:hypothetical protein
MAAPAFRAVGTASNNNNQTSFSRTPGLPAGTAADDILILDVFVRSSSGDAAPTCDTPTNYTQIRMDEIDISGQISRHYSFWRRAGSSESGPTVTGSLGNSGGNSVVMTRIAGFSGCITTGTPYEDDDDTTTTGAQDFAGPDVTTTDVDRLWCYFACRSGNAGAPDPPSGWTEMYDAGFAGGLLGRAMGGYKELATANTYTGETCTATNTNAWSIIGFALIPPGGGGGGLSIPVAMHNYRRRRV